jgi:hypothetical protein
MPRAEIKSKYDAELRSLSALSNNLRRLAKKARGRDAKTLAAALGVLHEHIKDTTDLRTLGHSLIEIENEHEFESEEFQDQGAQVDLGASILALEAVTDFLSGRVVSRNLDHLRTALLEIVAGAAPAAMFQPEEHGKGRRDDSPSVLRAKGLLAGMMEVQCSTGMTRQEAAEWIARNVSRELALRISSKPITPRIVEEWRDRYGGAFGEKGIARDSFLLWRAHDAVSPRRFREITEHEAKRLLARKPS